MKVKNNIKGADYLIFDEQRGVYVMPEDQAVRDDVEKRRWISILKIIIKDWRLYLMLVPMLFVFLCWRYLPMYELIRAFKDGVAENVSDQMYVGLSNFRTLFVKNATSDYSQNFWRAFRNTFLLSFYGLLFGFPMPVILALFFNEIRSDFARSVYQVLTYLPKFMSTVIMTTLVVLLIKKPDLTSGSGIIAKFLGDVGLLSKETVESGIINDPKYFRAIYEISGIWETAGYDSIVFFAAIIAISPTSYEAARIDGAGKTAQMRYVVLPSILSTVVIMLITRIGHMLNVGYEKIILLYENSTAQGDLETATTVSTFSYELSKSTTPGLGAIGAAAEMINNLIGMMLVIGANTIAKKAADVSLY